MGNTQSGHGSRTGHWAARVTLAIAGLCETTSVNAIFQLIFIGSYDRVLPILSADMIMLTIYLI